MSTEVKKEIGLEIGHVLFIDIVGYSKLLNEEQKERLDQLTEIALATTPVREATDEPSRSPASMPCTLLSNPFLRAYKDDPRFVAFAQKIGVMPKKSR